jgi:putative membrane protein
MHRMPLAAAALVILSCVSPAAAQVDSSAVNTIDAAPGRMTGLDFANAAAVNNKFEVQTGQLAAERAVSGAVRDFGMQMVNDHTQAVADLKVALSHMHLGSRFTPPPQLDAHRTKMLHDLQGLHGPDFDRLYVRYQIGAHRQALAVMQGYAEDGDVPELRHLAADTIPMIQHHLDMLRDLRNTMAALP